MPESPTIEQVARDNRKRAIIELAVHLFPEGDYDTKDENEAASVFQLLCDVTRAYTELICVDNEVSEVDKADTLQSVLENIAPSFGVKRNS